MNDLPPTPAPRPRPAIVPPLPNLSRLVPPVSARPPLVAIYNKYVAAGKIPGHAAPKPVVTPSTGSSLGSLGSALYTPSPTVSSRPASAASSRPGSSPAVAPPAISTVPASALSSSHAVSSTQAASASGHSTWTQRSVNRPFAIPEGGTTSRPPASALSRAADPAGHKIISHYNNLMLKTFTDNKKPDESGQSTVRLSGGFKAVAPKKKDVKDEFGLIEVSSKAIMGKNGEMISARSNRSRAGSISQSGPGTPVHSMVERTEFNTPCVDLGADFNDNEEEKKANEDDGESESAAGSQAEEAEQKETKSATKKKTSLMAAAKAVKAGKAWWEKTHPLDQLAKTNPKEAFEMLFPEFKDKNPFNQTEQEQKQEEEEDELQQPRDDEDDEAKDDDESAAAEESVAEPVRPSKLDLGKTTLFNSTSILNKTAVFKNQVNAGALKRAETMKLKEKDKESKTQELKFPKKKGNRNNWIKVQAEQKAKLEKEKLAAKEAEQDENEVNESDLALEESEPTVEADEESNAEERIQTKKKTPVNAANRPRTPARNANFKAKTVTIVTPSQEKKEESDAEESAQLDQSDDIQSRPTDARSPSSMRMPDPDASFDLDQSFSHLKIESSKKQEDSLEEEELEAHHEEEEDIEQHEQDNEAEEKPEDDEDIAQSADHVDDDAAEHEPEEAEADEVEEELDGSVEAEPDFDPAATANFKADENEASQMREDSTIAAMEDSADQLGTSFSQNESMKSPVSKSVKASASLASVKEQPKEEPKAVEKSQPAPAELVNGATADFSVIASETAKPDKKKGGFMAKISQFGQKVFQSDTNKKEKEKEKEKQNKEKKPVEQESKTPIQAKSVDEPKKKDGFMAKLFKPRHSAPPPEENEHENEPDAESFDLTKSPANKAKAKPVKASPAPAPAVDYGAAAKSRSAVRSSGAPEASDHDEGKEEKKNSRPSSASKSKPVQQAKRAVASPKQQTPVQKPAMRKSAPAPEPEPEEEEEPAEESESDEPAPAYDYIGDLKARGIIVDQADSSAAPDFDNDPVISGIENILAALRADRTKTVNLDALAQNFKHLQPAPATPQRPASGVRHSAAPVAASHSIALSPRENAQFQTASAVLSVLKQQEQEIKRRALAARSPTGSQSPASARSITSVRSLQ